MTHEKLFISLIAPNMLLIIGLEYIIAVIISVLFFHLKIIIK